MITLAITGGVYYLLAGAAYVAAVERQLLDRAIEVFRRSPMCPSRWPLAQSVVLFLCWLGWPIVALAHLLARIRKGSD